MKKTLVLSFFAIVSLSVFSQTTKPATKPVAAKKPATTTAASAPVLKTTLDSCSYAIGMLDGNFFKMQGITEINAQMLGKGFEDMLKNKPMMSPEQADMLIRRELSRMTKIKIQPTIDEGIKFLAENAKRPGVKQTASGLQYEVITEGSGPRPVETSRVKVHYIGSFINGQKFQSSRDGGGQPYVTLLNEVIGGWTEGIQLMTVGSRYKLYIPYQLGYREQGSGEIPGGAALIFDVELIEIVNQ